MVQKRKLATRARLIGTFLQGRIHLFVVALLFSVLATVFNALTPQVIKFTVDTIIGGAPPQSEITLLAGFQKQLSALPFIQGLLCCGAAILVIALLSGVCTYQSRTGLAKGAEGFVQALRDRLYIHIERLPFSWHVKNSTGEIIQRCTSDVEVVRSFIANQLTEAFRTGFLVVFSLSIMFSMNVKISLAVLFFLPILVAYSGIFYSKIARQFLKADEAEGALSATVQENLTGVRVVRAFGRERFEIDRFDERNERFSNFWIRLGYVQSYYWGLGDLLTGIQILTVILLGVIETVHGNITLGGFLAFVSYNTTLVWPVRGLGRILSEMSKTGVSIDRLGEILDAPEETDAPGALTPPMDEEIRFEHVTFGYGEGGPVLRDLDFTIPAGSTFAILGGTGSGKSTLTHLLCRLYDLPAECGKITVGGVDLQKIQREWVRRKIGIVLQEPFLFSRTIRENIGAARPKAPLEDIRNMARIAQMDETVLGFSGGYDTIVGERGVTLSGGQKQRVAIARTLLSDAPVMIFDDSLSAVDSETDYQIRKALQENLGRRTVILISHRITTLMQADRILVLEDGRAAQLGTHQELISQKGLYRDIYDIQMSADDRALIEEEGK